LNHTQKSDRRCARTNKIAQESAFKKGNDIRISWHITLPTVALVSGGAAVLQKRVCGIEGQRGMRRVSCE